MDHDKDAAAKAGRPQDAAKAPADKSRIEGEGSYTAGRAYQKGAHEFAKSGAVDKAAQDAAKAVDGPERQDLERAEQQGKSHAKGEDPALRKAKRA